MSNPYDERFQANLTKLLTKKLSEVHADLGNGTLIVQDDAAATGMRCARQMGMIAGLKSALAFIEQVEHEMSAKTKTPQGA